MAGAHQESSFEESITNHLLVHGWVAGNSSDYSRDLGLNPGELLAFVEATQPDEWARLITLYGGRAAAETKLAKRVASELTARGTVDVLRRGVKDLGVTVKLAYFAPAHDLTPELRALYDANRLCVTRQLHHSESNPADSVDLALFINGIPVATAELKTQTAGQNVADAIEQYRHDRNPRDLIFAERTVVHFAVDQDSVAMTTALANKDTVFLPFNQGSNGPGADGGQGNPPNPDGPRTAYLWERIWSREVWLGLFATYIHAEPGPAGGGKPGAKRRGRIVFPRFHQWDAVEKLLATTRVQGPGHNKLIQHSAGSGKSNSIAWLAHGLARLHTPADATQLQQTAIDAGLGPNMPVFDKVIIVTDRVVLDRQLQATVAGFDHTPGVIETIGNNKTAEDLRRALEGSKARIIVTTLQKFPVVAESATALAGTRFAVIADEAHSSQTGEAAKDLKKVLAGKSGAVALEAAEAAEAAGEDAAPDLEDALAAAAALRGKRDDITFFAFTATPKAKTLEMFGEKVPDAAGEERYVPFHLYSMRQAIEEKFILDVLANYTTYKTYYRLANGLGPGDDPVLPKGQAASALARFVSLHPTNLGQKTDIIVEHFRAKTSAKISGRAKAMVVTRSRLHAVKYYEEIRAAIKRKGYDVGPDPLRVLVAFSGTVVDPDTGAELRESGLNGFGEAELPARFASDDYQLLIVAEKYQTGFDQPLLHTMYVDKRLDGVKAVQTLSRLNRTYPGKDDTFVLDFANDAEAITEAFRPYYAQASAAPTDPNVLYTLARRIEDARVLDPEEVDRGVAAVLVGGAKGAAELNATTDPAIERYAALEEDDAEQFRTALRDFVRTYAFLAQVMPFVDADLERLYLYGKVLQMRLRELEPGAGESVNLDDSVVLTHLRVEAVTEEANASPGAGSDEPLPGLSTGEGKQHSPVEARLSELIAAINERFGMELGEADALIIEHPVAVLRVDEDVRDAARDNDASQFSVYMQSKVDAAVAGSQSISDEVYSAYFDKPDFGNLVREAIIEVLYRQLRAG